MGSISAEKAQGPLLDAIKRAERDKERVFVKRKGKKVAAVVPIEDVEALEEIEDREDVEDAKKALAEPGGKTWEKLKAELGLP